MLKVLNPEKYRAGLYERLSNEKIEVIDGVEEAESGSISTQKLILENFCKDNKIAVVDHYTDDGVSGATFDRPNFKRLIKDIENGKINLVIVKDLSRFGRASNVSNYLDEYFPEKGVRFIAINDDIDTGDIIAFEKAQDSIQFKTFMNEFYLRDTARKIKTGKRTRAREGKVMATYPTYGYKKDPKDKNHYIVDEETAPIVKRIFALAKEGKRPTDIGKILTDEKVPVPSEKVGNNHTRKGAVKRGWNRNTVVKILQNVTYLGWVSNGNTKKANFKSKKVLIIPKEERIIVKGMHEALVDEATFNLVQQQIESRKSTRVKTYDYLLKGLVCCKECGKKLSVLPQKHPNKTTFYLRCNTYYANTQLGLCTPHSNNLEKVTNAVITQIKKRCMEFLKEEKYQKIANENQERIINNNKFSTQNQILLLERKIRQTNDIIDNIYKEKCIGTIKEEDFSRMYAKYTEERNSLNERIEQMKQLDLDQDKKVDIMKIVKEFVSFKEVTREMLVSLVDRIEISQDKEITIYYKFSILNVAELKDQEQEDNILQIVG